MSTAYTISVRNLSKTYRLFNHPGDRIKQFFGLGIKQYHREFTALRDISFNIGKGESVAILGHNGSGKSTLLQIICGILKPTSGSVDVNGRISALLELGAGFNPEFTGRENVFFQALLQGLTNEQTEDRFDSIAAFADIGEFIDQPVRTYSSGMFMRLAFAVATNTDPEILIVDEALSVGDLAFQFKSRQRMKQMIDNGSTLIVVSHDRATVASLCQRCLLLDHSKLAADGIPADILNQYQHLMSQHKSRPGNDKFNITASQLVSGTGEARVTSIRLTDANGRDLQSVTCGTYITLELIVAIYALIPRLVLGFSILDSFGRMVFGVNTNSFKHQIDYQIPGNSLKFCFAFKANLSPGIYSISTALVSTNDRLTNNFECRENAYVFEVNKGTTPDFGGGFWLEPTLKIN
jgi:lipopolysaccharide transport system ATP-binding protein